MRDYGKIRTAFWTDAKLRPMDSDCKLLFAYLLSGPHTNALGCFYCPAGYIATDLGWSLEQTDKTLSKLSRKGFVRVCDDYLWLPHFLQHNEPENLNVWKHVRKLAAALPPELVKLSNIFNVIDATQTAEKGNPSETVSEPYRIPEPEPEPEPEKKVSKRVAAAPATKKTACLPDDWQLDGPGTKYATTYGFNSDQRDQMAADFREYYTEGDGLSKKRTDLGWRQSWQRWVRNQPNFSSKGKGNGKQPLDHRAVAADLAREIIDRADGAHGRAPGDEHHSDATEVENFNLPGDIVTVVDRGGVVISDPEWSEDPVEVVSDDYGDRARVPEGGPPELGESPESGSGVDTGGVSADSGGEGKKPRAPGGFEVPF